MNFIGRVLCELDPPPNKYHLPNEKENTNIPMEMHDKYYLIS